MAEDGAAKGSVLDKMKVSSGIGVVIFIVTLAIWIFFDKLDMRLDPIGTTVVATALTVVAIFVQWLRSNRSQSKGAK
jgi:uncharacterized membrane protein YobD (UPF0266 family)